MKVLYCFVTGEDQEPDAVQNFIDAYERNGATWAGTIDVIENHGQSDFTQAFINTKVAAGYEMILYNSRITPQAEIITAFEIARRDGLLMCIPVGANTVTNITDFATRNYGVLCGSGLEEHGNATGYPCDFFGTGESELAGIRIIDIRQTGTSYTVTEILRTSATRTRVKLDGITTEQGLNDIGLIMYQNASEEGGIVYHSDVPVYFSSMSGSDILPLLVGVKYVSFVGEGFFEVIHASTAGTIGGSYQAVTGTMKFGYTDDTRVMIQLKDFTSATALTGITIDGVTGFENDINGRTAVTSYVNNLGYGDKVTVTFDLGTGSATANGTFYFSSQSYSTPEVGGLLANIKDTLGISWSVTIGRAIQFASEGGTYDSRNGYGVINPVYSSDSLLDMPTLETPVLTLTAVDTDSLTLSWTKITYASYYEVYFRGELYETLQAQQISLAITLTEKYSKGKLNLFKVRAVSDFATSEFSNSEEFAYYYYRYIPVTVNDPSFPVGSGEGYGYNYGYNYGH